MKVGRKAQIGVGGREARTEVDKELNCQAKCSVIPQI